LEDKKIKLASQTHRKPAGQIFFERNIYKNSHMKVTLLSLGAKL